LKRSSIKEIDPKEILKLKAFDAKITEANLAKLDQ